MNSSLVAALLLVHVAATLCMTGLIWYVQIVHYPLFAEVGAAVSARYEQRHVALTTWVVGPPLLVEAGTGLLLVPFRPAYVPERALWVGLGLLLVIWVSTALLQIPCHRKLGFGFDAAVHRRLVRSNWLRTAGWTARSVLVLWMVFSGLQPQAPGTPAGSAATGDVARAGSLAARCCPASVRQDCRFQTSVHHV